MTLLRTVFLAQLLVMLSGFAMLLVTPTDFQTLALMFYLVIIGLCALLFALWQFIRHPARRRWALATAATPLVCLTTPFLIVWLNGAPVPVAVLIATVIALLVIGFFVLLARSGQWHGDGVFANKRLNIAFVIMLGMLFALYWLPIVGWLYNQESWSLPQDIGERDPILRILGIYFVSVAGPALLLSLFALLYAPIGLVRNAGGRIVHGGQLLVALLSLTSLTAGAFALSIAIFNPG